MKKIKKGVESVIPKNIRSKIKIVDDPDKLYIYSFAITVFLILSNAVINIPFKIGETPVFLGVFTYPFALFFSCIVLRKYGLKEVIQGIVVAVTMQILMLFLRWIVFSEVEISLLVSTLTSFILSEAALVTLYYIIIRNKKETFLTMLLLFIIIILFDNSLFLSIYNSFENNITLEIFEMSNAVKLIMSIIITYLFKYIKW